MDRSSLLRKCGLFAMISVLASVPAFAQWELDRRLTYNDSASYTSFNNARWVAASGDTVHVGWCDYRVGNSEIYYKRSTDGGAAWGSDIRLTNDSAGSWYPAIAVLGGSIHVIWVDYRDGNREIYYKRSTDRGATWGADTRLTYATYDAWYPSVAVSPQSGVHVVWNDGRDGNSEIYYKRSSDGGATWGSDVRLTYNPNGKGYTSVAVSDSNVHVVWRDERDGLYPEIYYKRSTDGGTTWEPDVRLTNDIHNSYNPSVTTSDSMVHIVWEDDRDRFGYPEIYYKRSTNKGSAWGPDIRLTYDPNTSWEPSISASGSKVHMVWSDGRDGGFEIYYKCSTDTGSTWTADYRLTNDPDTSRGPSIAVSGSRVHVVWRDHRDGNNEIYYKRNPTGNSGMEEDTGRGVKGTKDRRVRVTPNPFTAFAAISGHEGDHFVLYDISGRVVGTYQGDRMGADLSSGVYFVKEARQGSPLQRIIKIR
jgi:hypothetical protein